MPVQDGDTLKSYFALGLVPTPSQYDDLVDTIISGGGGGGIVGNYVRRLFDDTILATHTFNPFGIGPPFILGDNAQGQTVSGLKADQLNKSISVSGLGLSGGGILDADRTITLASSSNPGPSPSILASDDDGFLNLLRLNVDVLGDRSGGSLLLIPTGNVTLAKDTFPQNNYSVNLGSINKKYLTLHAAELWVETLVAQDTMATIGGRILVAPTTTLVVDVPAADGYFYAKHNQMTIGDFVYMEADGKVEWMRITNGPAWEPAYSAWWYAVTRNLDGTGANDWFAGDAVLNTGQVGNGYIDIYSLRSNRSDTQMGPTILGNYRWGTTYNSITESWALGNLRGLYGYGTSVDAPGIGLGNYQTTSAFVTIDTIYGIRMHYMTAGSVDIIKAQWGIDGTVIIGVPTEFNTLISAGGIQLRYNTTSYIDFQTSGDVIFGRLNANYSNMRWNATTQRLEFRTNTDVKSYIDTDGAFVVNTTQDFWARAEAITWTNGSNDIATLGAYDSASLQGVELRTIGLVGKVSSVYVKAVSIDTNGATATLSASNANYSGYLTISASASATQASFIVNKVSIGSNVNFSELWITGNLTRWLSTGLTYTGYIFVPLPTPLTSGSWDGDELRYTESATIDLHAVFNAPLGIKAIAVLIISRDSATLPITSSYFMVGANSSYPYAVWTSPIGSSVPVSCAGIVPCDANGNVWYKTKNTGNLYCEIYIYGYFI